METRANTRLIYGNSGTFKTTQIGFMAEYIWRKYHKITRLISAEGWAPIQDRVDAGLIVPWGIDKGDIKKNSPLSIVRKLSKGWWPKLNPHTGKLRLEPTTPEEWKQVGGIAIEGLDSIGDLFMEELRIRHQKVAEEVVSPFTATTELVEGTDSAEQFSASARSHYGFVQREVHGLVRGFSSLPVQEILFSSHEAKGEDEETRMVIRGPGVVGSAVTGSLPGWVGDCLHADSYSRPEKVKVPDPTDPKKQVEIIQLKTIVRVWFVKHPDEKFTSVSYPAKLRVPSRLLPKVYEKWPGGYFEPSLEGGLDWLIELEDQLTEEAAGALKLSMAEPEQAPRAA